MRNFTVEGKTMSGKTMSYEANYSGGRVVSDFIIDFANTDDGVKEMIKMTKKQAKEVFGVNIPRDHVFIECTNLDKYKNWVEECKIELYSNCEVVGYTQTTGCDTAGAHYFQLSNNSGQKREEIRKTELIAEKLLLANPGKYNAKKVESTSTIYSGFEVDSENAKKLFEDAKKEAENEEKVEKKVEEKKEEEKNINSNEKLELAKKTGKKQIINTYSVDCGDTREECNTDIITEYIYPDGHTEKVRTHTW